MRRSSLDGSPSDFGRSDIGASRSLMLSPKIRSRSRAVAGRGDPCARPATRCWRWRRLSVPGSFSFRANSSAQRTNSSKVIRRSRIRCSSNVRAAPPAAAFPRHAGISTRHPLPWPLRHGGHVVRVAGARRSADAAQTGSLFQLVARANEQELRCRPPPPPGLPSRPGAGRIPDPAPGRDSNGSGGGAAGERTR